MDSYLIFILVACAAIATPGPAVLLTLSNSLKHGGRRAVWGIMGVASGILLVSALSATSIGVILATSALAFTILKYVGAAYLIYMGIKMWRSPPGFHSLEQPLKQSRRHRLYLQGLSISLMNPKAIFFFMTLFPQFVDIDAPYAGQFVLLTLTFCACLLIIHSLYALAASRARIKLSSPAVGKKVNRLSGSLFMLFGFGLAASGR
ncbi:LysE family translocator [Bowmanella denitrificans]|uniref:LysE family translocator n=1 Tax=Bowmanella denitrificans TaxID=366582 RepID=UPI000C9C80DF|nr:LysE family translocator [Bowmanella denitrificans]